MSYNELAGAAASLYAACDALRDADLSESRPEYVSNLQRRLAEINRHLSIASALGLACPVVPPPEMGSSEQDRELWAASDAGATLPSSDLDNVDLSFPPFADPDAPGLSTFQKYNSARGLTPPPFDSGGFPTPDHTMAPSNPPWLDPLMPADATGPHTTSATQIPNARDNPEETHTSTENPRPYILTARVGLSHHDITGETLPVLMTNINLRHITGMESQALEGANSSDVRWRGSYGSMGQRVCYFVRNATWINISIGEPVPNPVDGGWNNPV